MGQMKDTVCAITHTFLTVFACLAIAILVAFLDAWWGEGGYPGRGQLIGILLWVEATVVGLLILALSLSSASRARTRQFLRNFVWGPGALGGSTGLLVAEGSVVLYSCLWSPTIDRLLVVRIVVAGSIGWLNGVYAGSSARDEWLRQEWASHRVRVGFLSGLVLGGFFGLASFDLCIILAGAVGAAVGGMVDSFVHSGTLEETWP